MNYGTTIGTISGTVSINAANEVIYAFVGTNNVTPTTFLSAITNRSFTNGNGTLMNTGLTVGDDAVAISGNEDVMVYSGPTICSPEIVDCMADIANAANWSTEDGSGNQAYNSVYPDFPDDTPVVFVVSGVLPISLTSFTVELYQDQHAIDNWTTETETNNNSFKIEKSSNGSDWEHVESVMGAGTSTFSLNYEIIDANPNVGVSYYRLKQTDFDGAYTYSFIVSLNYEPFVDISLYPNPTLSDLTISGTNIQEAQVLLFNDSGMQVPILEKNREKNKILFDVTSLKTGKYIIRLVLGGEKFTKVFIKT